MYEDLTITILWDPGAPSRLPHLLLLHSSLLHYVALCYSGRVADPPSTHTASGPGLARPAWTGMSMNRSAHVTPSDGETDHYHYRIMYEPFLPLGPRPLPQLPPLGPAIVGERLAPRPPPPPKQCTAKPQDEERRQRASRLAGSQRKVTRGAENSDSARPAVPHLEPSPPRPVCIWTT